jgi:hypothetical protein
MISSAPSPWGGAHLGGRKIAMVEKIRQRVAHWPGRAPRFAGTFPDTTHNLPAIIGELQSLHCWSTT